MKYRLSLTVCFLFFSFFLMNAQTTSIFRHINIGYGAKIELGDSILNWKDDCDIIDGKYFLIKNGTSETKAIELVVNKMDIIYAMVFTYENVKLKEKIKDYSYLGIPKVENKKAFWDDGSTCFEIYKEGNVVYSKLIDLKD